MRNTVTYSQSALATSSTLAWLYVGVLSTTFVLSCWLLQWLQPVDMAKWDSFNAQVPSWVFTAQVAAFGGVLVLNIINLTFCSTPVQYNCNVLLALIHGTAFATDLLLHVRATPVVVSWGGRMFVPLRYLQWVHTTPTMILLMAMMSSMSSEGVLAAVGADLVMVATGLAATWTSGAAQLAWLLVSMVAFMGVMYAVLQMFRSALAESHYDPKVHSLMERLLLLTLLVWALFPAVWMTAWLGYVSLGTEQLLWGISDYAAKVVFSSHMWQKNLATVQQRREAAQELLHVLDRGVLLGRLHGLLAAKERLVHALQHELTTPIHGMMALVQELLHNKTQSASSRTRMLLMIRSSAVCLLHTISTALNSSTSSSAGDGNLLAQADGADTPPGSSRKGHKVHLWRVAESVVRLTRPLMRDHVAILNCISRDLPPVKGDSARVMQVLMNLVCSSLKYTHSGAIKISASQTHKVAHVVVADSGSGIPPALLRQALDPFELMDGAQGPGSSPPELWDVCRAGLGLYLVKQTLNVMGSSLQAASEVGKGSTFEFDMAVADSDDESESEVDADLFSEPASLRGSLDLLGPADASQGRRSFDVSSTASLQTPSRRSSTRDLQPGGSTPLAATEPGRSSGVELSGVGATLLSGTGGVGSAAGAVDAAAAAAVAGMGMLRKQNHRMVHDGVIQVLSVDDDQVNQLVASTALRSHKWEVVKCMSGAEALDYLLQRCTVLPDLVLLDVMMPTVSGYEVAKRIREVWPSSVLPIIMVSAKTEEEDIVQGLRCGADDYIPKPFKRAELAARIRAHIRARDAFQQQQASEQQWMLQHNLLPLNVQRKLRNGETVIAESHPAATVLWAEVMGPTAATAAAAAGGVAGTADSSANQLPAALARISSQQQLLLAAADVGAAVAQPTEAHRQLQQAAAAAAADTAVSRSSSAVQLLGLEGAAAEPLGLGSFPPGLSPAEAVVRLNSLYTTWEELCAKQDVLGVDFSGSTFVAVSGHDDNPNHARLILRAAAAMLSVAAATNQPDGSPLQVRMGIHTGPLTTGLVGSKAVKLVLMGETVDGARQLAATGCPGLAHISSEVHAALDQAAAAATAPWTHQRLPGALSRRQTYLLRTPGTNSSIAAEAAAASSAGRLTALAAPQQPQQQQELPLQQQQSQQPQDTPGQSSAQPTAVAADTPSTLRLPADFAGSGEAVGGDKRTPEAADDAAAVMEPSPQAETPGAEQQQQQQPSWQQSLLLQPSTHPRMLLTDSPPQARVSVATTVSSLAVGPLQSPSAAAGTSSSSSDNQQLSLTTVDAASAGANAALVAVFAGQPQQHSSFNTSLSLLELQQAGGNFLTQLGVERRQLQEQLLERTQQHAAAAAELACVKEQLQQANATADHRAQQIEAMQQQLTSLMVRAHMADCWQAIATMKAQVSTLAMPQAVADSLQASQSGATPTGYSAAPGPRQTM